MQAGTGRAVARFAFNADVRDARPAHVDGAMKALNRRCDELLANGVRGTNGKGAARIPWRGGGGGGYGGSLRVRDAFTIDAGLFVIHQHTVKAVFVQGHIDFHQVAGLQLPVIGNTVHGHVVDACADGLGKPAVE